MIQKVVALLCTIAFVSFSEAYAIEVDGVTFPDSTTVDTAPLVLNGTGIRAATIFNVHVYVAALYVASKNSDSKAIIADPRPKQLVMEFKREIGKDDMQKAWRKSFALNNPDADVRMPQLNDFISIIG